MRRLLFLVNSRAAAIRLAPLILHLRVIPALRMIVCAVPAQGRTVIAELAEFGIVPDEVLDAEQGDEPEALALGVNWLIEAHKPDWVLVQGNADGLMASFSRKPAYGNLGSGLRAYQLLHHPAQQGETSRIDLLATQYFVTTEAARDHLLCNGIETESIFVSDSTAVDALLMVRERITGDSGLNARLAADLPFIAPEKRLILVLGFRRDQDSALLESACRALKRLAMRPDVQVVYPAHPDPQMQAVAEAVFANHPDIHLIAQQDYLHHVYLMQSAHLVLTASGEIQEEALSLGKPLLLMRDADERPQAEDAGTVKRVGSDMEHILLECSMFLDDPAYYRAFAVQINPAGDGLASLRIAEALLS